MEIFSSRSAAPGVAVSMAAFWLGSAGASYLIEFLHQARQYLQSCVAVKHAPLCVRRSERTMMELRLLLCLARLMN